MMKTKSFVQQSVLRKTIGAALFWTTLASLPISMALYQNYWALICLDSALILYSTIFIGVPQLLIKIVLYIVCLLWLQLLLLPHEIIFSWVVYFEPVFLITLGFCLYEMSQNDDYFSFHRLCRLYVIIGLIFSPFFLFELNFDITGIRERNYFGIFYVSLAIIALNYQPKLAFWVAPTLFLIALSTQSRSVFLATVFFIVISAAINPRQRYFLIFLGLAVAYLLVLFDRNWGINSFAEARMVGQKITLFDLAAFVDRTRALYYHLAFMIFEQAEWVSIIIGRSPLTSPLDGVIPTNSDHLDEVIWLIGWSLSFTIDSFVSSSFHSGAIKLIIEYGLISYLLLIYLTVYIPIKSGKRNGNTIGIFSIIVFLSLMNTSVLISLREFVPIYAFLYLLTTSPSTE